MRRSLHHVILLTGLQYHRLTGYIDPSRTCVFGRKKRKRVIGSADEPSPYRRIVECAQVIIGLGWGFWTPAYVHQEASTRQVLWIYHYTPEYRQQVSLEGLNNSIKKESWSISLLLYLAILPHPAYSPISLQPPETAILATHPRKTPRYVYLVWGNVPPITQGRIIYQYQG